MLSTGALFVARKERGLFPDRDYKLTAGAKLCEAWVCVDFGVVLFPLALYERGNVFWEARMEELICGKYRMQSPAAQFSLSTDTMALADFARVKHSARVCDLGCGSGALGVLLLARDETLSITGVEIQEAAARCAMENAALNSLSGFSVLHGDLREYRTLLPANGFDAVISNPPYYPLKSGAIADDVPLAIARSELCCTLSCLCACAAWCLRFGGSFFLVHKPERLTDLLVTLRENRLEPKRLQFVRHHPGATVSLVLIEARLGAKPGLTLANDLLFYTDSGEKTADYKRLYHEEI